MKKLIKANSLVILAKSHNPTLISDHFLKDSGIILDIKEINPNTRIITPAVTQLQFVSGVTFNLDAERLMISGGDSKEPYEMGQKYCNALGYIKANAIGINFDVSIREFDFDNWFGILDKDDYKPNQVRYLKQFGQKQGNITITRETNTTAIVQFNFHYQYALTILKDLKLDFVSEWNENKILIDEALQKLLNK